MYSCTSFTLFANERVNWRSVWQGLTGSHVSRILEILIARVTVTCADLNSEYCYCCQFISELWYRFAKGTVDKLKDSLCAQGVRLGTYSWPHPPIWLPAVSTSSPPAMTNSHGWFWAPLIAVRISISSHIVYLTGLISGFKTFPDYHCHGAKWRSRRQSTDITSCLALNSSQLMRVVVCREHTNNPNKRF